MDESVFTPQSIQAMDAIGRNWHSMPIDCQEITMPTRNVVLTDHQAAMVEKLVSSGRYQNASEVLREGLRLVEQREAEDAYRLQALRSAVKLGIDDIEAGRFHSFHSKESLHTHLKSVVGKGKSEE